MEGIKTKLLVAFIFIATLLGAILYVTKLKLDNTRKELSVAQLEASNMKKFYEQREKDNKKTEEKYKKVITDLKSDECGSSSIPVYLYEAIKQIEDK